MSKILRTVFYQDHHIKYITCGRGIEVLECLYLNLENKFWQCIIVPTWFWRQARYKTDRFVYQLKLGTLWQGQKRGQESHLYKVQPQLHRQFSSGYGMMPALAHSCSWQSWRSVLSFSAQHITSNFNMLDIWLQRVDLHCETIVTLWMIVSVPGFWLLNEKEHNPVLLFQKPTVSRH